MSASLSGSLLALDDLLGSGGVGASLAGLEGGTNGNSGDSVLGGSWVVTGPVSVSGVVTGPVSVSGVGGGEQASDLENSYIGDDRDIVVDIGQISDPSYYLDLLFSLNTTPGNSNGQR